MSLQKYSVVMDNESRTRDRGGRPWVGWTGLSTGRGGPRRAGTLSRAEKAGLLGMVAVVVIILSVVVTSGDRNAAALSPDSQSARTNAALNAMNEIEQTQPAPRPGSGTSVVNNLFPPEKDKSDPAALQIGSLSDARKVAPRPKPAPPKPRTKPYTIKRGDTLGAIARRYLGKAHRWREIASLNPKVNPNRLKPGVTIQIPPK